MLRLGVPLLLLFLRTTPPLLLLLLLSPAVAESSVLPAPQNLTIYSHNLQNILRWSPVKGINGSVFYKVQLSRSEATWENVNCTNITKPECDFDLDIIAEIILRVRAEQGELKSAWTKTVHFQVKRNTTLGPPREINIISEPNLLVVRFLPPFEHTARFFPFEYTIDYWEKSTSTKVKTKTSKNTEFSFSDLKERTEYCFQIKVELSVINKTGQSDPYCKQTATTEATTILYVTLILGFAVFVLVAIFLSLIVIRKYQSTIKSFWQAPLTIPSHYEEDLQNAEMCMGEEFQNSVREEQWDTVSVISNAEKAKL